MNNDYFENQISLINDNINVSSEGDGKILFKLLFFILCIIIVLSLFFDFFAGIVIDNMPAETQLKIEALFKTKNSDFTETKYKNTIEKLNYIKKQIIRLDKNIQNKSSLPIYVMKNKNINAMILPDGTIYFTSGLLEKNYSEQELAFVLAHEMGHYSHKDHLKSISKQIFFILLYTLTGLNQQMNNVVQGITNADYLNHSRRQEEKADLYAGEMLIKLYGSNSGGKKFIKNLKENEKNLEFLQYFSTHPSWEKRLYLLEKQQLNNNPDFSA